MSSGHVEPFGFGTYTIFNSSIQYLLGIGRRDTVEEQHEINNNFELELLKAKEEFNNEMEATKLAMTRAKCKIARRYKAIETKDRLSLNQKRPQLIKFLKEDLPLDPSLLNSLGICAEKSKELEEKGAIAPLNVVLLMPIRELDKETINSYVEENFEKIGDIKLLPWTIRLASGNASLFNMNVLMRDIPTLVISPRYIESDCKVYFSAALWNSNSENSPYIRPIFEIDFDHKLLFDKDGKFSKDGQRNLGEKIAIAASIVAGCARDTFMLMNYGKTPTLPKLLFSNTEFCKQLFTSDFTPVRNFVLNEYTNCLKSLDSIVSGTANDEVDVIRNIASNSLTTIQSKVLQLKD